MIEADKVFSIAAPIDNVWDYVRDITKWALLLPGCRECLIIDDHRSQWTIKVGAGGLMKTVKVLVVVDKWDGPERVNFAYQLESEPVVGGGSYLASRNASGHTDIKLRLRVEGSGPMAPMWEAVCKPLFHPLASTFTDKLKAEIEQHVGIAPSTVTAKGGVAGWLSALAGWWRRFWLALAGSKKASE